MNKYKIFLFIFSIIIMLIVINIYTTIRDNILSRPQEISVEYEIKSEDDLYKLNK